MSAFEPDITATDAYVRSNGLQESGKWANPVRPTFFVQGWSVTFLLQQFVVANAAAASERRIV
jgi:hypothetical protein